MKKIVPFILLLGLCALISGAVYNSIPKTAFVDNQQLFDAFQGRKELETRLEQESNGKQAKIDSLGLQIQAMQQLAQTDEGAKQRLQILLQQYQQMNQEHQGFYQYKSQEYTEAIWKQISQYTREYGAEKGYDYVFGVAGSGSLMYGKAHYDITEDVIKYINSKYAGN
ncbi:OmpH family outer membrane protein [Aureispira anguillae]|uniref:OmpH family outer membrane protein n=1 Tax=Aureispira anguillae TaxID=2864201 RepID=A0A915YLG0_9BACT|nr:OmpH family outer membrane protein [Aureispira anguillae]BDS15410.1 OmpH family outer membrane protein [Aureispira anguillae]